MSVELMECAMAVQWVGLWVWMTAELTECPLVEQMGKTRAEPMGETMAA